MIADRDASSTALLAERLREVTQPLRAGDEPATRFALRGLAAEAALLAKRHPLISTPLDTPQRIAAERDGMGRTA